MFIGDLALKNIQMVNEKRSENLTLDNYKLHLHTGKHCFMFSV